MDFPTCWLAGFYQESKRKIDHHLTFVQPYFPTQLEYHDPFGQSITVSSDITEEKVVFVGVFHL